MLLPSRGGIDKVVAREKRFGKKVEDEECEK